MSINFHSPPISEISNLHFALELFFVEIDHFLLYPIELHDYIFVESTKTKKNPFRRITKSFSK